MLSDINISLTTTLVKPHLNSKNSVFIYSHMESFLYGIIHVYLAFPDNYRDCDWKFSLYSSSHEEKLRRESL